MVPLLLNLNASQTTQKLPPPQARSNVGALIIRIGFWGPRYYNCYKEPPKIVLVIIKAPKVGPLVAASDVRRGDKKDRCKVGVL